MCHYYWRSQKFRNLPNIFVTEEIKFQQLGVLAKLKLDVDSYFDLFSHEDTYGQTYNKPSSLDFAVQMSA